MEVALSALPFIWKGLVVTVQLAALVISISGVLGVAFGIVLTFGPQMAYWPIRLYSDFMRGTPVLVLLFFVFYGFPAVGINLSNFWSGVVALSLFKSAHVTEIVRGALQSVPRGQSDGAKSIGLTFKQALFYVVFPQAVRRFLPPWINAVVDVVKGSSLVSLIGVVELVMSIQQVVGRTFRPMPLYVLGALIYIAINFSLSSLSRILEARFAYIKE